MPEFFNRVRSGEHAASAFGELKSALAQDGGLLRRTATENAGRRPRRTPLADRRGHSFVSPVSPCPRRSLTRDGKCCICPAPCSRISPAAAVRAAAFGRTVFADALS